MEIRTGVRTPTRVRVPVTHAFYPAFAYRLESDQDNRRAIDQDNRWDGGFHGQDRETDQVPVASSLSVPGPALRHQFRIQGTSLPSA